MCATTAVSRRYAPSTATQSQADVAHLQVSEVRVHLHRHDDGVDPAGQQHLHAPTAGLSRPWAVRPRSCTEETAAEETAAEETAPPRPAPTCKKKKQTMKKKKEEKEKKETTALTSS
eukprot:COSAG01_NODE_26710_length_705_cov_1.097360_1_plen_116_part_01